VLSVWI